MKLLMYLLASFAIVFLIWRVKKDFNLKSKIEKPIFIFVCFLSLMGYLSSPYLIQKYIIGCEVDYIIGKTTYVTSDKVFYFYNLDSGLNTWSSTNFNEGEFICAPI